MVLYGEAGVALAHGGGMTTTRAIIIHAGKVCFYQFSNISELIFGKRVLHRISSTGSVPKKVLIWKTTSKGGYPR